MRAMEGPTAAITAGACGFRMESDVLEATANLYLTRQVILEHA